MGEEPKLKTYEVELVVTVTVEAENESEAEYLAYEYAQWTDGDVSTMSVTEI